MAKAKAAAPEPSRPRLLSSLGSKSRSKRTASTGTGAADVLLADGINVNYTLVKDGWCWWYRKYALGDMVLEGLEKEAREAKKGLWVDPAPIPPWVYRKARRGQSLGLSHLVPLDSKTESSGTYRGPPQLGLVQPEPSSDSPFSSYPIIGVPLTVQTTP